MTSNNRNLVITVTDGDEVISKFTFVNLLICHRTDIMVALGMIEENMRDRKRIPGYREPKGEYVRLEKDDNIEDR